MNAVNLRFLRSLEANAQKKLKYYPRPKYLKKADHLLTEFLVSKNGNPVLSTERLDPDSLGFNQPDFGFDYDFDFDDAQTTGSQRGWQRFMDTLAVFPKYERVKNYIDFVNQKKISKL